MIRRMFARLKAKARSDFGRALSMLISGTIGSQALTMAAMPLLARLFSPADFGALAVYIGIVTIISVSACLRFDIAVAMPESEDDAIVLLGLAILVAALVVLIVCLILLFPPAFVSEWLKDQYLQTFSWLIPIGIFASAICSALQNWHIRKRSFELIAKARLIQASAVISTQGIVGLAVAGPLGLLTGSALGFCANAFLLGHEIVRRIGRRFVVGDWGQLMIVVQRYSRFPIYSTWEALANQAAIHLPVLLIASALKPEEAGFLMLAMYAMQAPMSLLGGAVGQVYLGSAGQAYREGRLRAVTLRIIGNLVRVGSLPIGAIAFTSPVLFPLIFGESWQRAGWLVAWMSPWFLLQFLVSPVSMSLHVIGAQRTAMVLQFVGLVLRVGMTLAATYWAPHRAAEIYAVSGAIAYGIYLLVVLFLLRSTESSVQIKVTSPGS